MSVTRASGCYELRNYEKVYYYVAAGLKIHPNETVNRFPFFTVSHFILHEIPEHRINKQHPKT